MSLNSSKTANEIYQEFLEQKSILSEAYIIYDQVNRSFKKIEKKEVKQPLLKKRLASNVNYIKYGIQHLIEDLQKISEDLSIIGIKTQKGKNGSRIKGGI